MDDVGANDNLLCLVESAMGGWEGDAKCMNDDRGKKGRREMKPIETKINVIARECCVPQDMLSARCHRCLLEIITACIACFLCRLVRIPPEQHFVGREGWGGDSMCMCVRFASQPLSGGEASARNGYRLIV